jgi:hypothetical protein
VRCIACDVRLGSRESTRKGLHTGEFLDLCDRCYDPIKDVVPTTDNPYHSGQIDKNDVEKEDLGEDDDSSGNDAS